ncbi:hypothetical protein K501DRAFT_275594 [Backusella circina FSU 941]|nr:hypothetical protein K501DRAFT_275594 [Backusella circina FSU 941]
MYIFSAVRSYRFSLALSYNQVNSRNPIHLIRDIAVLAKRKPIFLGFNPLVIHAVDFLIVCNSALKYFHISSSILIVGTFNIKLNSIESFNIECDAPTGDLEDIISSRFANLVKLKFMGEVAENMNIMLKCRHFQQAILILKRTERNECSTYGFSSDL